MFDKYYLQNPIHEYLKWLITKIKYQKKYRSLRVGYMSKLSNVTFGKYNWTGKNVIIIDSSMDDFSYISDKSVIYETTIGKFCSIGPNVRTAPGKHPTHTFVSTHPALYSNPSYCMRPFQARDFYNPERKVNIGNDVWVGANVVIADGVSIGNGAIIGANSIVTSDVEPYTIVGGVPARQIRKRFDQEYIDILIKSEWWNKNLDWIEANADKFLNIVDFCDMYRSNQFLR